MSQSRLNYSRYTLVDFVVGIKRERSFVVDEEGLLSFVVASGDSHPLHISSNFARTRGYRDVLVHGMCISARCSSFVTEEFVGSHGLLVSMSADFRLPVFCNELLTWQGEALSVDLIAKTVEIKWVVLKDKNTVVQQGTACAWLGGVNEGGLDRSIWRTRSDLCGREGSAGTQTWRAVDPNGNSHIKSSRYLFAPG